MQKYEVYKSGYTQKWVVLCDKRYVGHFDTEQLAIDSLPIEIGTQLVLECAKKICNASPKERKKILKEIAKNI